MLLFIFHLNFGPVTELSNAQAKGLEICAKPGKLGFKGDKSAPGNSCNSCLKFVFLFPLKERPIKISRYKMDHAYGIRFTPK